MSEGPKEACGLFGVWAPGEDVARITFFGLYALQHRGQESAGMAVSDGGNILVYRELGLVSQVFNEGTLATLQGDLCIGHTRYSTTGSTTWENAQPTFKESGGRGLALGHNGNLVNTAELAERVGGRGRATTDTDLVSTLLARELDDGLEEAALRVLPTLRGAFSFVLMDERTVYAARDPHGIRPLALGRLSGGGWVVASETAALDVVGASFVREIEPGRAGRHRRPGRPLAPVRRTAAPGAVSVRVRVPRPGRLAHVRAEPARGAQGGGARTGPRGRGRGRHGHRRCPTPRCRRPRATPRSRASRTATG